MKARTKARIGNLLANGRFKTVPGIHPVTTPRLQVGFINIYHLTAHANYRRETNRQDLFWACLFLPKVP
jgi:hypothetical protein